MRRICITYQMHIKHFKPHSTIPYTTETAESCITLPMRDLVANDLLAKGIESRYLREGGDVRTTLEHISWLQGYNFSGVCKIDEE